MVRYLDAFAVNAKHAPRSIAASMGLKCVWYALGQDDVDKNLAYTVAELEAKAYPLSWWKAPLAFAQQREKPRGSGVQTNQTPAHDSMAKGLGRGARDAH